MNNQEIRPRAKVFEIGEDEVTIRDEDEFTEADLQDVARQLGNKTEDLQPGDVVHLLAAGAYRNSGRIMWTGTKFVDLDYDEAVDEYGSAPAIFRFPDYPLDHFYDSIDHNFIIRVAPVGLEFLARHFVNTPTGPMIDFDQNGKHYTIVFERDIDPGNGYAAYDADTGKLITPPVRPAQMTSDYFRELIIKDKMAFRPTDYNEDDSGTRIMLTYTW